MAFEPRSAQSRALAQKIAANTRHHGYESPVVTDLRGEKAVEDISYYVQRVVESAPPLTKEQLDRIAVILRPTPSRVPDASKARRRPSNTPMLLGVLPSDGGDAS
jgi:hypothetical protein